MSFTDESVELHNIKLHTATSNEDENKRSVNVFEESAGDAAVETTKNTQINIETEEKVNQVLEEKETVPIKMKRYRGPVFWVQIAQKKQDTIIIDEIRKPEKVDKRLNPLSHGVRWLQQDGFDPIPPKPEFEYDRQTQNKFITKVFIVLLVMLLLTLVLQLIYLEVLNKTPDKKARFKQVLPISSLAIILLSVLALLMINYFWSCTSWSNGFYCFLYLTAIIAVFAMSSLTTAVTVATDTYVCFFELLGTIVAAIIGLLLSIIPKINFSSRLIYAAISIAVCSATAFVAFGIFKAPEAAIYTLAADFIVFLVLNELRLILTHSVLTTRIYEEEYVLVACLMFVSPISIFMKLIWIFDFIDLD